jgi:hypothetical protein
MRTATRRLDIALTALAALLLAALILTFALGGFSFRSSHMSGSGVAATQRRSLPPFTGVELAGDNNVIVRAGERQSVVVHADRNLLGRVTTRVRSGRLVIGTTPGNLAAKSPMYVTVDVPALDSLELAGHGNIAVTGIDARHFNVDVPGAGTIDASGTAAKLDVTIAGAGTAQLGGLISRDVQAALSGSGTIMLTATRSLAASLSGTGAILYRGDPPRVIRNISGSGTISAG